jgi:MFS family permease
MTYWGELRTNWRLLAATTIGLGAGYSLNHYISNIFTPHLLEEFKWARSDLALLGATFLLSMLCQPIVGRIVDAYGVRRVAIFGVIASPLIYMGYAMMSGSFFQYFILNVLQILIVSSATTPVTYTRLIAQKFDLARGFALGVSSCAPAATAALCVPFLSEYIDGHGWRAGYMVVAATVAVGGALAMLLIPPGADVRRAAPTEPRKPVSYREIVRNPAFIFIVGGIFFCNFSFNMQFTQLKVILLDRGIDSTLGSAAVSLYAFSVIIGRIVCGAALDRWPAYTVAAISLGLPAIGLVILASGVGTPWLLFIAVLSLGLAMGGDGDVLSYLVMTYFRVEIYSTVLGLILSSLAISVSFGSFLLSTVLKMTGSFTPFLILSAVAACVGSGVFMMLRRVPTVHHDAPT